ARPDGKGEQEQMTTRTIRISLLGLASAGVLVLAGCAGPIAPVESAPPTPTIDGGSGDSGAEENPSPGDSGSTGETVGAATRTFDGGATIVRLDVCTVGDPAGTALAIRYGDDTDPTRLTIAVDENAGTYDILFESASDGRTLVGNNETNPNLTAELLSVLEQSVRVLTLLDLEDAATGEIIQTSSSFVCLPVD
ncbi:MAG TPA: hypothetical protein PK890_09650, partial [Terrimesophilobacter sp.]|nr:hypothetical protein [Terrimesophilobacter sp.]